MLREVGLSLGGVGVGGLKTFKADVHKARAPAKPFAETQNGA